MVIFFEIQLFPGKEICSQKKYLLAHIYKMFIKNHFSGQIWTAIIYKYTVTTEIENLF